MPVIITLTVSEVAVISTQMAEAFCSDPSHPVYNFLGEYMLLDPPSLSHDMHTAWLRIHPLFILKSLVWHIICQFSRSGWEPPS